MSEKEKANPKSGNGKVKETVVATTEKTKNKKIPELLTPSATKGEKLSGIVRLMGEAENLRNDDKRQTMLNKVSKAGQVLEAKKDAEIMADEKLAKVGALAVANIGVLKTNAVDKDAEISEELIDAYETLLSYGKSVKFQEIEEDFGF